MDKQVRLPGPDHPIAITPFGGRVVVKAHGQVIADTRNALILREASYPPVYYIPRGDADMAQLARTTHQTYCSYKGEASYFSLPGAENAVWSYEAPHPAMAAIKDHLAFYANRVDGIEASGA